MKHFQSNWLLVEGKQDERVLPQLVEAGGIPWGESKEEHIVEIQSYGGFNNLNANLLNAEFKRSGLRALGLIADANANPLARWKRIRELAKPHYPDFPSAPLEGGTVMVGAATDIRFGVWLMPDNSSEGMLETFLSQLGPSSESLWDHVSRSAATATQLGAPFKEAHRIKAELHTWLAWQDPPGEQLHIAAMRKFFEFGSPEGGRFIEWFRQLYEIE